MRPSLCITLALLLGFGLGWFLRPSLTASSPDETKSAALAAPVATQVGPASETVPEPGPASTATDRNDAHRDRIETLRWLRQAGVPVRVQALSRDTFSPALGKILGLDPAETARLNDAAIEAKRAIDADRLAHATPRTSEDGKMLIVEVPAIDPSTSRGIYERLLETLTSTLGPERYGLFNELTGDSFDAGFDQFGLNTVRYELMLEPRFPATGAPPHFEYKRHFLDPTGISKGWSGSTVNFSQLEKNDPILGHFVPPHLQKDGGK